MRAWREVPEDIRRARGHGVWQRERQSQQLGTACGRNDHQGERGRQAGGGRVEGGRAVARRGRDKMCIWDLYVAAYSKCAADLC